MVSACSYSGAYPTGYGLYELNTEGVPPRLHDEPLASGFTHFQQSGTGAIRKYYNYFRVTPMLEPLDALGTSWPITDEDAEPGYYAATLSSGIRCELTVGPKSAVHRYTFPAHRDARLVVDFSLGGLAIPYGATVPLRAHLSRSAPGSRTARSSSRARRSPSTSSATRGDWRAAALVRPPADAGRHAAGLRPDPADDAAPVRADVARAAPSRARWWSCASASPCAAPTRPGRTCAATRGARRSIRRPTSPRTRRGRRRPPRSTTGERDPAVWRDAPRPDPDRDAVGDRRKPSSPPRSTTR